MFGSNVVAALPPKVYTGHIISKNQLKITNLTGQLDYTDPAMKLDLGNQIGNNDWAYESNWLSIDRYISSFDTRILMAEVWLHYAANTPESSNGLLDRCSIPWQAQSADLEVPAF